MRISEAILIFFVAFLFYFGKPIEGTTAGNNMGRQAEQERPPHKNEHLYTITYKVEDLEHEEVYDIYWLRKASELAIDKGLPYFNVLEQKISKYFSEDANAELSIIKGTIEITSDPMTTDYDANEILGLNIGE